MTSQTDNSATSQGSVTSSIFGGIKFIFQDEGQRIVASSAFFSPKKHIEVNGKEVSKRYSISGKSPHQFTVNKHQYEVEITLESTLLHRVSCTLIKNGTHVETLRFSYTQNRKAYLKIFIGFFLFGAISGFIGSQIVSGW